MTVDPKTLTFAELQAQVGAWSQRNFPGNRPSDPFEGCVEELGELAHSRLKARQGIRGTAEKHLAAEKDAIGDIVIYLADFAERNDLDLQESLATQLEEGFEVYLDADTFADLDSAAGLAISQAWSTFYDSADECFRNLILDIGDLGREPTNYDAGEVLIDLATYCHHRGFSLAQIVTETWTQVRKRDWQANRVNGQAA